MKNNNKKLDKNKINEIFERLEKLPRTGGTIVDVFSGLEKRRPWTPEERYVYKGMLKYLAKLERGIKEPLREFRNQIRELGIPEEDGKEELREMLRERGHSESWINSLLDNWDSLDEKPLDDLDLK